MIASVTRLRVRSFLYLPAFLWMTYRSQRQVGRASGFRGGKLLVDRKQTYWTLTMWEDERAMKSFRGSGAHAQVMPKLVEWCDEAAYAHWASASNSIPDWPEAHERLIKEGRLSRVAYPSPDHEARKFPAPRLKPLIGQGLKPVA
jgi:Domain of unknown function (DUF3291)